MTVGMSTVFAFLGILVISMHALARVARFFPPEQAPVRTAPAPSVESAEAADLADIAVVLAAIEAHRRAEGSGS